MSRLLFLLLMLVSAGLAARVTVAAAPATPKIGIVSVIGDKFYLRKVGITVFGNEAQEMAIDSWRIDDIMTAKLRAALARRLDAQVRLVSYRRAAFANLTSSSSIGEWVRTEVSPHGLDSYLIVHKRSAPYGRTNQTLLGLGMVEGQTVFGPQTFAHAYYALSMVDGRTFSVSGPTFGRMPDGQEAFGLRGVTRRVEPSWWPTSLDDAANQRLKDVLVELFDRSIPRTLLEMQKSPSDIIAIERGGSN